MFNTAWPLIYPKISSWELTLCNIRCIAGYGRNAKHCLWPKKEPVIIMVEMNGCWALALLFSLVWMATSIQSMFSCSLPSGIFGHSNAIKQGKYSVCDCNHVVESQWYQDVKWYLISSTCSLSLINYRTRSGVKLSSSSQAHFLKNFVKIWIPGTLMVAVSRPPD